MSIPRLASAPGPTATAAAYDVHPYMLLNYNGQYHDVSTLAHELGHALHSYYSNQTQPHPTADYSTFVAEVASTLNEALLIEKMLSTITDDPSRLSLLMNFLDGIKGTIFRQTQFAEFELAIHRKAEQGEPLTGDALTQVYGEILKRYYGHDAGRLPRGRRATASSGRTCRISTTTSTFTSTRRPSRRRRVWPNGSVKAGPEAVRDVKRFLSAGGSEYPVQILKQAGVDMLGSEPFDRTMAVMNRVMDQIEAILNKAK